MQVRKSLSLILLYSVLGGCSGTVEERYSGQPPSVEEPSDVKEPHYTTKKELAKCLVEESILGFGDGAKMSQEQKEIFGKEAWAVMSDSYTECFKKDNPDMSPKCSAFGLPNLPTSFFPIWIIPTDLGARYVGGGPLPLETLAGAVGCEYNPRPK